MTVMKSTDIASELISPNLPLTLTPMPLKLAQMCCGVSLVTWL